MLFGEASAELTSTEVFFVPTEDTEFSPEKTYYEQKSEVEYIVTEDEEKNPDKTYYERLLGDTTVYHDFTDIYSVQKSPFLTEYNEIMIWLQRKTIDYD